MFHHSIGLLQVLVSNTCTRYLMN